MNADFLHDAPVANPVLWQRPEHLADHLGVTVRTLRKWVAKGQAERTRSYRGQVYYRLTETMRMTHIASPPPPPAPAPASPPVDAPSSDARVDALEAQLIASQAEVAEFRRQVASVVAHDAQVKQENEQLRRELDYQKELAALPWWARQRRRDLTMPMGPLDLE